jgi:hypothetical protein
MDDLSVLKIVTTEMNVPQNQAGRFEDRTGVGRAHSGIVIPRHLPQDYTAISST